MSEPPWESFEEYVIRMIETKQSKSPEFKKVVDAFGRDKIQKIWNEYKKKSEGRLYE